MLKGRALWCHESFRIFIVKAPNLKIEIKGQLLNCEIKNSSEGIRTGMMNRARLDGCMLFMLPSKGKQSFYMLNCLVPLDIVFCLNSKVTAIHKNCPPCEQEPCATYEGIGDIALEFNGGFCDGIGLAVGDSIKLVS